MTLNQQLIEKIEKQSAIVGIVGLGYVGLPLVVAFCEAGLRVVGMDVDEQKVAMLRSGDSYVEDVESAEIAKFVSSGLFTVTTDYAGLAETDAICICVPTPLKKNRDPDISYVQRAGQGIAPFARGKLIALESTIFPGGTEEALFPYLLKSLTVGKDLFIAFSPERIDPGRTDHTIRTTPKVVGGSTPACLDVAMALYGTIVDNPVPVSSLKAAELVKLLENMFRMINIGMVNELALMCDRLGVDVWEVIEAAATKPYGFMKFTPGPGIGGHCIPIDPHYLSWTMRGLDYTPRFIELATDINSFMPEHVVNQIADGLNQDGKPLNGSNVLILGVAYKPGIADVRESPAMPIIEQLQKKMANVSYHDPYAESFKHGHLAMESVNLNEKTLNDADCVVIVTNHKEYDWAFIGKHARVILDTRNAMKGIDSAKVIGL